MISKTLHINLIIILYASEILGTFDTRNCNKYNNENIFDQLFSSVPTEKINLPLCRYVLKVNRKTPKPVLYGELGSLPLYIDVIMSMFKYLIWLFDEKPKDSLLDQALSENITMVNNNKQCWLSISILACQHIYKQQSKILRIVFIDVTKVSSM